MWENMGKMWGTCGEKCGKTSGKMGTSPRNSGILGGFEVMFLQVGSGNHLGGCWFE